MESKFLPVQPIKTEKTFKLANKGIYTFKADFDASNDDIVSAINELYKVNVVSLATMKQRSKKKMNWKVRKSYYTVPYKKVYVKLANGQKLDLYK